MELLQKTAATFRHQGPLAVTQKIGSYVRYRLDMLRMARLVAAATGNLEDVDERISFAYAAEIGRVRITPGQLRSEIYQLLRLLERNPPQRVLEIGSARGGTLFLFAGISTPEAVLISVDLPGGPFGGGYRRERARVLKAFRRDDQRVELLRANSHDPATLATVRKLLDGAQLDFLMIDGDHRYAGVRGDFEMYAPLVRPGGLIALHDIVPGDERVVGGVPRFWEELKGAHDVHEIVESWDQKGYGLGVLVAGNPH